MITICIDAGHYAKYNSGAIPGYWESEMTWKLANYIRDEILKYKNVSVKMTRTDQKKDLDVYNRGYMGKGCDACISIHSNAADSPAASDVSAIVLSRDDRTDLDEKSVALGEALGSAAAKVMGLGFSFIKRKADWDRNKDGLMNDEWYGFLQGGKDAKVVTTLIEFGFHTHQETCKWLMDDKNLQKLAKAEAEALANYFKLKLTTQAKYGEPQLQNKSYRGAYRVNRKCYFRSECRALPSNVIAKLPVGAMVHNYNWYSKPGKGVWLWVTADVNGETATGFVYKKWLKRLS